MLHGHGDDIYNFAGQLKGNFSSNVLPYGHAAETAIFLQQQIDCIGNYPEPSAKPLAVAIARQHNISIDNVLPTNGATEAFYLLAELFAGEKSTIPVPSFAEYEDACRQYSHRIKFVENTSSIEELSENKGIIWLCNPNNPDGKIYDADIIVNLAKKYRQTIFIVDEAYIDFSATAESLVKATAIHRNIIVTRSLTKKYAVPGLRLGYIVAHSEVTAQLERLLMPWRLGSLAIAAGVFLLQQPARNFAALCAGLLADSVCLQRQIDSLPHFSVIPSETNYFLVECQCPGAEIKQYLLHEHAILVRDAGNFRGLSARTIRISTQTPQKNELLLGALSAWKPTSTL